MSILRNEKQEFALHTLTTDNQIKYLLYGGAAGGGKTWLGCFWLYMQCLEYDGVIYFLGRDRLKDTRESVLETWYKVCKMYGFSHWRYSDNKILFDNGSKIIFLDLSFLPQKDPFFERLGSKEYTGGWIEEAGETKFDAFDVLKTRVGRQLNDIYNIPTKILITANPKKGWLYSNFYKRKEPDNQYLFIQALAQDNNELTEDYMQNLNNISDKTKRERLLLGNWDYDETDNCLIQYDAIQDLFFNKFIEEKQDNNNHYITADIAAFGSDKFVVYVWKGLIVVDAIVQDITEPDEVVKVIERLAGKYNVPRTRIAYDADGLGTYLRSYLKSAIPIINNSKAIVENYANLKTQLYYKLAELINNREIYFKYNLTTLQQEELKEELQEVKSKDSDKDGKLKIEPKEEVKSRIGRSPDLSDPLAFRMIFVLFNK